MIQRDVESCITSCRYAVDNLQKAIEQETYEANCTCHRQMHPAAWNSDGLICWNGAENRMLKCSCGADVA